MKRVNPYTRLLSEVQKHLYSIMYRHRKTMWRYAKEQLNQTWRLNGLWERVAAAEQLGYDVVLEAKEDGLHVVYVKKIPDTPFEWR